METIVKNFKQGERCRVICAPTKINRIYIEKKGVKMMIMTVIYKKARGHGEMKRRTVYG